LNTHQPQHVAIIMDGNGRWAKQQGLPRIAGHQAGVDSVRRIIREAIALNLKVLSLFAFSSENWRRPVDEVEALLQLFLSSLQDEIQRLHEKQVRLRFIGDLSRFTPALQQTMADSIAKTQDNQGLILAIYVNYGGRWDLTHAMQQLAQQIETGRLSSADITEQRIESVLATHGLPDPDLLIRTSGEQRISNYFLWQLAYAELYFTSVFWPEFTVEHFREALSFYEKRTRRFGHTDEQIQKQSA
jgi:undecaprenyl diphosphate synthase